MHIRGDCMSFDQNEYISKFNKNNYKMYQFRVKKKDVHIINHLDNIENRNSYIISLINKDISNYVYTLKEIKTISIPPSKHLKRDENIKKFILKSSQIKDLFSSNKNQIMLFDEQCTIEWLVDLLSEYVSVAKMPFIITGKLYEVSSKKKKN